MGKPDTPSREEIEAFRRAVGPVRRLQHDKVEHPRSKAAPRPRARQPEPAADSFSSLRDEWGDQTVAAEDSLLFARPGVQYRQLQRLRRGQLHSAAELDLHGMTVATARAALNEFFAHCSEQRLRCVRIIHGKGGGSGTAPVLKNRLNAWLRQHPDVLAFSSATSQHGGSGALYILLRARRG